MCNLSATSLKKGNSFGSAWFSDTVNYRTSYAELDVSANATARERPCRNERHRRKASRRSLDDEKMRVCFSHWTGDREVWIEQRNRTIATRPQTGADCRPKKGEIPERSNLTSVVLCSARIGVGGEQTIGSRDTKQDDFEAALKAVEFAWEHGYRRSRHGMPEGG
jgi:hypothetical protein